MALAAGVLLVPVRSQTLEQWLPVLARFGLSRLSSRAHFRAQRGQLGHLVALPSKGLDPSRAQEPHSLPAELAGLEFLEGELARYDYARFGAVSEARAGTLTAALRVRGRAFALLSSSEREERLSDYGAVLSALARDASPIRRLAWIERTLPGDGDALGDHLLAVKAPRREL